ncbi:accessory gene regulator B family protein [Dorea formicigenerans]|nr:accessory gene regulator B family protein [Dorea formicigenerans]
MISYYAEWIVKKLVRENLIEEREKPIYQYGTEMLIVMILNFFSIFIIGFFSKNLISCILYILIFVTVRTQTGGYHAATYLRCWCLGCTVYLMILVLTEKSPLFLDDTKIIYTLPVIIIAISYHTYILCMLKNKESRKKICVCATARSIGWAGIAVWIQNVFRATMLVNVIIFTLLAILFFLVIEERRVIWKRRKKC